MSFIELISVDLVRQLLTDTLTKRYYMSIRFLTHFRQMFQLRINQVVDDLHLYLRYHSSTGVFQIFR